MGSAFDAVSRVESSEPRDLVWGRANGSTNQQSPSPHCHPEYIFRINRRLVHLRRRREQPLLTNTSEAITKIGSLHKSPFRLLCGILIFSAKINWSPEANQRSGMAPSSSG